MIRRQRKSKFVKLFDKTPPSVVCPHFYELVLSNGCPFDCSYCYLKLTFRGRKEPVLYENPWPEVERELDKQAAGVFSTGELADSLAVTPPLLKPALDYFERQQNKYLLLLTKSINTAVLLERKPTSQVIVSFSINAPLAARTFELHAPDPIQRLKAAEALKKAGWRIRFRIDPIILDVGLTPYREIARRINDLEPERVTIGSLRQYPGLFRFAKNAPREGLYRAPDGRMRYSEDARKRTYETIASWLSDEPALCKETRSIWRSLGWKFNGCNCSV